MPTPDPNWEADLKVLPLDTGGTHTPHARGTTAAAYGYYVYLPGGYNTSTEHYPLIISLHGSTFGESSYTTLYHPVCQGLPALIEKQLWHPIYPMIVVTPQNYNSGSWVSKDINTFMTYLQQAYRVNPARIYLTGISMGGYGTYNYLTDMKDKSQVAAAIPVVGNGQVANAKYVTVPIWAFHGDKDSAVSYKNDIAMIKAIKAAHPTLDARITIFPGLDHEERAWTYPYDFSGHGLEDPAYDAFNEDVYRWMLQYKK